jgi:hypothetical protein
MEELKFEARVVTNLGNSPLALAVEMRAPLKVVKKLLLAYPGAVNTQDNSGVTPIIEACRSINIYPYEARFEYFQLLAHAGSYLSLACWNYSKNHGYGEDEDNEPREQNVFSLCEGFSNFNNR